MRNEELHALKSSKLLGVQIEDLILDSLFLDYLASSFLLVLKDIRHSTKREVIKSQIIFIHIFLTFETRVNRNGAFKLIFHYVENHKLISINVLTFLIDHRNKVDECLWASHFAHGDLQLFILNLIFFRLFTITVIIHSFNILELIIINVSEFDLL